MGVKFGGLFIKTVQLNIGEIKKIWQLFACIMYGVTASITLAEFNLVVYFKLLNLIPRHIFYIRKRW